DLYVIYKFNGLMMADVRYKYDVPIYSNTVIDLLGIYNIALLRKSCIIINPNYPNDFVRSYIDWLLREFNYGENIPLEERIVNLTFLYLYFLLNGMLLNIKNMHYGSYKELFGPFRTSRTVRWIDEIPGPTMFEEFSENVEDKMYEMDEL